MDTQVPERVRKTATITLDSPIIRGETTIATVMLRSPQGGELRGINLQELVHFDTDTIMKIVPRISTPMVAPQDLNAMDVADLVAFGDAIANFLPQKGPNTASPQE